MHMGWRPVALGTGTLASAFSGIEVPSDVRHAGARRVRKTRYGTIAAHGLGIGFRLKMADSVLEWHGSTSLEFHCILMCNRRENMRLWSPTDRHCCPESTRTLRQSALSYV